MIGFGTSAIAAGAAALLLLPAAASSAQPAVPLNQPWSAEGRLDEADSRGAAERPYDDHPVRLPDTSRFRISAESDQFDTMIQIFRAGGEEPLAEDDDGGEGFNSRLSFPPPEAGTYIVRVLGYSPEAAGAYRVQVEALPQLPPPIGTPPASTLTTSWSVWEGALAEGDFEIDEIRGDDYAVTLNAGEQVIIRAQSEDFDTVVRLYPADGREGDPIAEDDDDGSGLNSFLIFTPEESGEYVVRVTSYEAGEGGDYRLMVGR